MLGKQLGKKALLIGAIVHSLPDIDVIASLWLPPAENLLAHRGVTHSLLFDLTATLLFTYLASAFYAAKNISSRKWALFFSIELSLHLFIDLFNNYGTGLLEPFDNTRFSFDALYVADPFFSLWTVTGLTALALTRTNHRHRKRWSRFALIASLLYLSYAVFNKLNMEKQVHQAAATQVPGYQEIFTTPAPLNNWLWFVAIKTDSGFFTGYKSALKQAQSLDLTFFPQNRNLPINQKQAHEMLLLRLFSRGWYTLEQRKDTLVFNDLRFGQVIGWHDPRQGFAFSYFPGYPSAANRLVVQRGRFAKWSRESTRSMIRRIRNGP